MAENITGSFEDAAVLYECAANALEVAIKHCRTAAKHFRSHEVPRGCAHGMAAYGELLSAREELNKAIVLHSSKAVVE